MLTVNGEVAFHRAYYHCDGCGQGCHPHDAVVGLHGRYSPGLVPLIALAGVEEPFRLAKDLLGRLAGIDLSAASCRRVTERLAGELHQLHQSGGRVEPPVSARDWDFRIPDEAGRPTERTAAYVSVDAFAVAIRQGDGSIAWRMLYAGLLYDPSKEHSWYVADFDRKALAATLRRYACRAGYARAEVVVALTDGGNGLEELLADGFSAALVFVLDFWHASQHLHAWAGLRFGRDSPQAREWAEGCVGLLREQGGAALVGRLREEGLPAGASEELREGYRQLVGYFAGNVHRTDYPSYRAKGWDIGSGPVEAGCKVLAGRLKRAGARWLEPGAEDVAGLRALYHSGDGLWDAFWADRMKRRAA